MSPTATQPDVIVSADPDFIELAQKEVETSMPGSRLLARLGEGVLLWSLAGSFWTLAERWQEHPPVFVRHINPVQAMLPLPAGPNAVHALRAAAVRHFGGLMDPSLPFSVQTRLLAEDTYGPFDVNTALAQALEAESGAPLNVRQPQQILSVVVADYAGETRGFLGLSPALYNLSDWAGGKRRFRREKEQISRAEFKLLEAVELFDIPLPANGVVLDLGAAPGGWTRILRLRQQYVTAVDPAELDAALTKDAKVRHLQMTAEQYLQHGPDQFDLIVNDMRLDARDSARLMVSYAPYLYRDGRALMTLKLPEEKRETVIDHTLNILREAYEILGARQLFHNRSEITVYLRPLPREGSQQD